MTQEFWAIVFTVLMVVAIILELLTPTMGGFTLAAGLLGCGSVYFAFQSSASFGYLMIGVNLALFPLTLWLGVRLMVLLGLHPMKRAALRRRREWPSREEVIDRLRDRGIYRGWTEEALACFADYATRDAGGKRVLSCPPELEAEIYGRPVYPWPSFRTVNVPVLFLHGTGSHDFLPPASRLARRHNPAVEVATVPGRHCFMLEDPAAAHAAVAAFLGRHDL